MNILDYRKIAGWGLALLALLAAGLVSVSLLAGGLEAAHASPGDIFEIDGNTAVDGSLLDWDHPDVVEQFLLDATASNSDWVFKSGQKLDGTVLPWETEQKTATPSKSDLADARFFQLFDGGELFGFVAASRLSDQGGSASVAFVFSQAWGSRTNGDLLLILGWKGQGNPAPAGEAWLWSAGGWNTNVTAQVALVSEASTLFVEGGVNLTDLAALVSGFSLQCPGLGFLEVVTINSHSTSANIIDTIDARLLNVDLADCAQLTVVKEVDDASQWSIAIDGDTLGPIANGGSVGPVDIAPNSSIPVSESGANGADAADYDSSVACVDDDDAGATVTFTPAGDGQSFSITLQPFQNVTCTFTNTLQAQPPDTGEITFVKVVLGEGAADPSEWTFDVDGGPQDIPHNGTETLEVGSYAVTESGPTGYDLTNASGVCSLSGGVITLTVTTDGGTCTFTNTLQEQQPETGTIVIVKNTLGGNGAFGFTGSAGIGPFTLTTSGSTATTTFAGLTPGAFSVAETSMPANWSQTSASCTGENTPGSINLGAGETVTCTFTNSFQAPPPPPPPPGPGPSTLTLVKVVVNDDGGTAEPGDFTLRVNGNPVVQGQATVFPAGLALVITETGPDGYTQTAISAACDGNTVTLGIEQAVTCTITNDDVAPVEPEVLGSSVLIEKVLTSADPASVGETVTFRVTVSLTGDTTVTNLGILDVFEQEHLTFVSSGGGVCSLLANVPDAQHSTVACSIGTVTPGTPGNPGTAEFTFDLTFTARSSTLPGRTVNQAFAVVDLDGDGPAAPTNIGPATADLQIVEVAGLQLPPAGDGSMAGDTRSWLPVMLLVVTLAAATGLGSVRRSR